ncbi:hypothetical protein [Nocardioides perillae]|uniref:Sulfotransferase family protein n=1 Tax=Nocardioides perillae TaxID=1119534 RepID=A0A7Y9RTV3_9ACTN|nr:hypothetical protein [Nocardioides perillae]NYG55216.1 hypothetical protein [Nocardioides perillae]
MAVLDRAAGIVVTAAPGTGSTALLEALLAQRDAVQVPDPERARAAGVDAKHGTVRQLVAAGLLHDDPARRTVTTTRNPFDFYVAEHQRTRTRWVEELRKPDSWVHTTPGVLDQVVDAVTLDFDDWLVKAVGEPGRPRRINAGHVDEADVVLRMESLEADLRDLLGLEVQVPRTNVTDRDRAYWRSYTVAGRRLVEQAHAHDLALFDYRF